MSDYRRWRIEGGTYFFTLVTHQRRPILTTALTRAAMREAIAEVRQRQPFRVLAIVLLPDHLHAILELPRGDSDYSTRWRQIKALVTHSVAQDVDEGQVSESRRTHRERGIWHRRFYEHTCRDEADVKGFADYIHVNPLKHGLVDRVIDWPWSSFHRYVCSGEYEPTWGAAVRWDSDEFEAYE